MTHSVSLPGMISAHTLRPAPLARRKGAGMNNVEHEVLAAGGALGLLGLLKLSWRWIARGWVWLSADTDKSEAGGN